MADELDSTESVIPVRLKQAIRAAGAVLALLGLPPALNLFCIVPLSLLSTASHTPAYGMVGLILVAVTLAAGGVTFYHANQSLNGKPSKPIRLRPRLFYINIFLACLFVGVLVNASGFLSGLLIPPLLSIAAALPPLWAISWFFEGQNDTAFKLTWRRGAVAFAGGASAGLFIAIALEILLPFVILVLGSNLFDTVSDSLGEFLNVLGRTRWSAALTTPGFIYVLLQITLIAPLVEEFAKPLAILPILRRLNRQEAFLIGAIAGAGFAVLENSIYATIGIQIWVQFLFVRALGSAVQPLGAGLVALGWRDVLRGEPGAWGLWARRYGIAVLMHAIWNAGSLLVVAFGEAFLSGNLPLEFGLPGIVATGCLFISLALLGLSASWLGRALVQGKNSFFFKETREPEAASANRTVAIWALACLITILPAGIILSRLWLR
jgi:RsiW-degrading membrane proteinase PrsW (M82 family)